MTTTTVVAVDAADVRRSADATTTGHRTTARKPAERKPAPHHLPWSPADA
ncbi:hypothetical protein [Streptomyces sp. Z26]|nr:hypothetical protein [Streptomyces sp. Z26]